MSTHSEAMHAPAGLDHCPFMPTYGAPAVRMVKGEGCRLWDEDGNEYLDFLAGIAVVGLGHANPEIADAIAEQARTLVHVSNLYGTVPGTDVAITLDRLLGGGGQIFFTNSGAEAIECAIKLARKWGGGSRYGVVSAYGSFHGRTLGALHATGQPAKWEGFQPLPEGFRHVAWNDLAALEAAIDPTVAAVLLEPIQGEGGVHPATAEYFEGVRRLCDERGLLMIVDEIQTGLGRTGEWFGFQHFGVEPDVVTMARPLAMACPLAHAGPSATSPRFSSLVITVRPMAGNRWRHRRREQRSKFLSGSMHRNWLNVPGPSSVISLRPSKVSSRCVASGCSSQRNLPLALMQKRLPAIFSNED